MMYLYRGIKVFYKFFDSKKEITNLYLHGWGDDHKNLLFCKDYIKDSNSLFVDFPPFGESEKQIPDWNIFTYVNMIISLCEKLDIKKINIIGHSFGGRIAILLAVLYKENVNKIILVDSAGLKPKYRIKYSFRVYIYKLKKKLGCNVSKYGSEDYLMLSHENKKVFVSIVNTYLDEYIKKIICPTLIIFGSDDKDTPLYMAKKLNKNIKESKLVILKDAGHFSYLDRKLDFLYYIKNFLKEV